MSWFAGQLRSRRGQVTVELALILPVVVFMLVAVLEGARAFTTFLDLHHATREGVRVAVTHAADSAIEQAIYRAVPALDPERLDITITPPKEQRRSGEPVTVTLTYEFPVVAPFVFQDVLVIPLESTMTMRME